jgi:hypothetical protein
MIHNFLDGLIGSIYKILPLKEENNSYLDDYLDSLAIQLTGALETYPELSTNTKYISIVNSIQFFRKNEFSLKQCRREVFKCIESVKKIQKEV